MRLAVAVAVLLALSALWTAPAASAGVEEPAGPRWSEATVISSGQETRPAVAQLQGRDAIPSTCADACPLSWASRAGVPPPRGYLAAAALPDGRILAIGGWTFTGPTAVVAAYTPATDSWLEVAHLSTGRNALAAATIEGVVYALGGYTTGVTDLVEAYDPTANVWSARASMPTARAALAAAVSGGKLYAIGGRDDNGQALAVVEEYDPVTNAWRSRTPVPTARYGLAAAAGPNGRIYAIGGSVGVPVNIVQEYDPQTDLWRTVQAMSVAREGAAAVAGLDGRIYVMGGYTFWSGNEWLASVEAYDPASNAWQACGSLGLDRGFLAGVRGAGNILYALGGARGSGLEYVSTVEAARAPLPFKAYLPLLLK